MAITSLLVHISLLSYVLVVVGGFFFMTWEAMVFLAVSCEDGEME